MSDKHAATSASPSDEVLRAAISDITVPPGELLIGTGKYEKWALLTLKRHLERAGFVLSETSLNAAAPDLLAASELAIAGFAALEEFIRGKSDLWTPTVLAMDTLRAAIKKARGE